MAVFRAPLLLLAALIVALVSASDVAANKEATKAAKTLRTATTTTTTTTGDASPSQRHLASRFNYDGVADYYAYRSGSGSYYAYSGSGSVSASTSSSVDFDFAPTASVEMTAPSRLDDDADENQVEDDEEEDNNSSPAESPFAALANTYNDDDRHFDAPDEVTENTNNNDNGETLSNNGGDSSPSTTTTTTTTTPTTTNDSPTNTFNETAVSPSTTSDRNSSPVASPVGLQLPTLHNRAPDPAPTTPTTGNNNSSPASTPTTATTTGSSPAVNTPVSAPSNVLPRAASIVNKCGMTQSERSSIIVSTLLESTSPDILYTGTIQNKARRWIDDADDALLCADDERLQQRFTLAVLYFALNGREWTNCQADLADDPEIGTCTGESVVRWLSQFSECLWFGVTCDDNDRITILSLKENNLAGELPVELFTSLPWLSGLSLDHNKNIVGTIPSTMDFHNLIYIELDDNAFTGTFPDAFYSMKSLKAIDLNGNQMTGSITDDIGNLANLMVLQLEDNNFSGSIPADGLAELSNMLLLTLHGNNGLSGSLETVCDTISARRETSPEYLQFFSADCAANMECACCSACF